jgi:hypothetical protein
VRQSLSVVLERNSILSGAFATEPYEAAWASEARWFVRVLEIRGSPARLQATTQISPDGLHWCDLDDERLCLSEPGLVSRPVREFGGWLRLNGDITSDNGSTEEVQAKVLIYLVLKS